MDGLDGGDVEWRRAREYQPTRRRKFRLFLEGNGARGGV
jgi:hypothetical protein